MQSLYQSLYTIRNTQTNEELHFICSPRQFMERRANLQDKTKQTWIAINCLPVN